MTWSDALRSDRPGHARVGISDPRLEVCYCVRRRASFPRHLRTHGFENDILDESAIKPSLHADAWRWLRSKPYVIVIRIAAGDDRDLARDTLGLVGDFVRRLARRGLWPRFYRIGILRREVGGRRRIRLTLARAMLSHPFRRIIFPSRLALIPFRQAAVGNDPLRFHGLIGCLKLRLVDPHQLCIGLEIEIRDAAAVGRLARMVE